MAALGIFALISLAIMEMFLAVTRSRWAVWNQLAAQSAGEQALRTFDADARFAVTSTISNNLIYSAGLQELIILRDIDHDNQAEQVRYYLDGDNLKRTITQLSTDELSYDSATEVVTVLASQIANASAPVFYYYDVDYDGADNTTSMAWPVDAALVRAVEMRIYQQSSANRPAVEFSALAKLRNVK